MEAERSLGRKQETAWGLPMFPWEDYFVSWLQLLEGEIQVHTDRPKPSFHSKVRCDRSLGAGLHLSLLERGRDGVLFPAD